MAGEDHGDVGVRGDDLIVDLLRNLAEATGGEHVLVQVQHGGALRVLREHLVQPVDAVRRRSPAHVKHQKVDAAGGNQVEVTPVVLEAATEPRVGVVAIVPEIGAVWRVVDLLVAHVVVAGEHPVGQRSTVEHRVGGIRVLPLAVLIVVVDDISGVEQVLQVERLPFLQQIVVNIELPLIVRVVVILRVGLPTEREVVARAGGVIDVIDRQRARAVGEIGSGEALRVLDQHGDDAVCDVAGGRHHRVEGELRRALADRHLPVELLPGSGEVVLHGEQHFRVGVCGAVPAHPCGEVVAGVGRDIHFEELVGERCIGRDRLGDGVETGHRRNLLGREQLFLGTVDGVCDAGHAGIFAHTVITGDEAVARVEGHCEPVAGRVGRACGELGAAVVDRDLSALERSDELVAGFLDRGGECGVRDRFVADQVPRGEHKSVFAVGEDD